MPVSEFDIIEQVFRARARQGAHVIHGIGDDAAVVEVPEGHQLVISTDTLVSGVHFFPDADPYDIGYKSLAVNLSDIAAMGASPLWFTLSLTLPETNLEWLKLYAEGLFQLSESSGATLIGGNMARGPLSISITIFGSVPRGDSLLRSGARPGDDIYFTGIPGMAALGLSMLKGQISPVSSVCVQRLNRPEPRLAVGQFLRSCASACIDISDGLAADLGHILKASQVGARIELNSIPRFEVLPGLKPETLWELVLGGSDDYEMCFTAHPRHRALIEGHIWNDVPVSRIGRITAEPGIKWVGAEGEEMRLDIKGYQHF